MIPDLDTRHRLFLSACHWIRLSNSTQHVGEHIGVRDCSLCRKFWGQLIMCKGCPIAKSTKQDLCEATPHNAVVDWYAKYCDALGINPDDGNKNFPRTPEAQQAATPMRDFLFDLIKEHGHWDEFNQYLEQHPDKVPGWRKEKEV